MRQVPLVEAQDHLAELIAEASRGESVIITQETGVAVQLVPVNGAKPQPRFGSAKGKIKIADDFDAPLEDFDVYAP